MGSLYRQSHHADMGWLLHVATSARIINGSPKPSGVQSAMSATEEIKARLDIVDYIQQYAPLKKSGRYYKACCPFHNEKTPSFVVNPDTQSWRCFGACAEGGDIFNFAMKQHGWTFIDALHELGKQAGVETRQQSPQQRQQTEHLDKLRGLLKTAAEGFHNQLVAEDGRSQAVLRYAREKRGFTHATIREFMIGYAPNGWQTTLDELRQIGFTEDDIIDAGLAIRNDQGRVYDRFRNRLMIPIRDDRGRVVGFGARALDPDDNPKYLNSPQNDVFDKSHTLFGLDTAKDAIRQTGVAVIVEGYMDAIQAQQAGFANVVAQMGTSLTEAQLRLIAPRYAKTIILALDSDAAGQNATMRSLEVARQVLKDDHAGKLSVDMRVLQIPGAKDPDDLIREEPQHWEQLVAQAIPVADFVIGMETASLPENLAARRSVPVQQRVEIARRVMPLLVASEDNFYQQANIQKLAVQLLLDESDLMKIAQEQRFAEDRKKRQSSQSSRNTPATPTAPRRPAPGASQPLETPDDGPPPLDLADLEPPEDGYEAIEDAAFAADLEPVRAPRTSNEATARPVQHVLPPFNLEAHCLRGLLIEPDLWYRINHRFRELAGDHPELTHYGLHDLELDDFRYADYRALMQLFKMALDQDDYDVRDVIVNALDDQMVVVYEALLVSDEDLVARALKNRFQADLKRSWQDFERQVLPFIDFEMEMLEQLERLRLARLRYDIKELKMLQVDAEYNEDHDALFQYMEHASLAIRALGVLERSLQTRRTF